MPISELKEVTLSLAKGIHRAIEFCGKHPFVTGLFALLSLFGLALSVIGYQLDREEAKSTTVQVQRVEEKLDKITMHEKSIMPHFKGNWTDEEAFGTAWRNPRPSENSDVWGDRLERSFFIALQGRDVRVLLTSFSEGGCNACQIVLSIFVFVKKGDEWHLTNDSRDFTKIGRSDFNSSAESIEVFDIGLGRFGIRFETVSWFQGETYKSEKIFTFVADELVEITGGVFHIYFSGIDKKEAIELEWWFEEEISLSFDKAHSSFGLYDIVATYTSSKIPDTRTERYKFDGSRYQITMLDDLNKCNIDITSYIKGSPCLINNL